MDAFENKLNFYLIDLYRRVVDLEKEMVTLTGSPLSISEIHLLEAVGDSEGGAQSVSGIAAQLGITLSSVTIAVGKLVKKGYLKKQRSERDARSVVITLNKESERIYRMHRYFHSRMIRELTRGLDEHEKQVLLTGVEKLDTFFKEKVEEVNKQ